MSGVDERPPIVEEDGNVLLPLHMRGKVTVVRNRFSDTTKCEHSDCNEDDAYLICIGPKARLSTLLILSCKTHLNWAIEKVYESWTELSPSQKRYYTG